MKILSLLTKASPTKQVGTTTVEDTSLRFRFRKEGSTEWFRNISLNIQKTYRYIFDTSDASLVNRNLKFYENVYRTKYLVQAFTSTQNQEPLDLTSPSKLVMVFLLMEHLGKLNLFWQSLLRFTMEKHLT